MHLLKPNTKYKLVVLTMACPVEEGEAMMADAINETMRESMIMDNSVIHDYSIDFRGPEVMTDGAPEEGSITPIPFRGANF